MGALTSNRKRGEDYCKSVSPIAFPGEQSYGHISKKAKPSVSMSESSSDFRPSNSVASRLSRYPDAKAEFPRKVHAPERNSRFSSLVKKSESSGGSRVSSSWRMGNVLGNLQRNYDSTINIALKSLKFFQPKEKEVIEIDDDEEEDSSIEEAKTGDLLKSKWKEGEGVKMQENHMRSLDSSVVTDVSNLNDKIDGEEKTPDLMHLDQEGDELSVPYYRKLHESSKKSYDKLNRLNFDIEYYAKRFQGYRSLRSQKKEEQDKKLIDFAEECFRPLTEEEEREVRSALSTFNRRKVLVSHQNSNIDITVEKFKCLSPGAWLNDEVINVYLELLKEREKREPQKFLKCHFFNTFFYKKLISGRGDYNFQSVRRWTTQRKLGYSLSECDKIFVPIHQQIHWCLAIINKKEQKFQYLDSLGGVDFRVLDMLARYYVDEVKDKNGKDIDVSSWEKEFVKDLPEQENGFDCGVFMIKYADFYSRDLGLCFSQDHMPYFRLRTASEILKLRAE